jgi:hypothetical protein
MIKTYGEYAIELTIAAYKSKRLGDGIITSLGSFQVNVKRLTDGEEQVSMEQQTKAAQSAADIQREGDELLKELLYG